jgi:hypothetical protein
VAQHDGDVAAYRLPCAHDLAAVETLQQPRKQLLAACITGKASAIDHDRIERSMARRAPLLSRVIEAACAHCAAALTSIIHVPSFVVAEFAWRARGVFDDVHLLARGYGWSEAAILALPGTRRRRYAALLRTAA